MAKGGATVTVGVSHYFSMTPPLGYKVSAVCSDGHPLAYEHETTHDTFVPFAVNRQVVCVVCLAMAVGVQCIRPHMAIAVEP